MSTPWGLYVHVPWCRIRCPYCPFVVVPDRDTTDRDAFVDRVLALRARRARDFAGAPRTVYLGGGTPSRLPVDGLRRLLDGLVGPDTVEVTVEANPEDVDAAWLNAVQASGVTRLSLGVQTLDPRHARRLGRAHTPADARRALSLVRDAGLASWSVDLMFGLPDQTVDDVVRDVDALLAAGPPHVSLYGLTIEPGTPFARAAADGRLGEADEDLWSAQLDAIVAALHTAGLRRYEVSNAARPGHEAVHNRGYWQGLPYLGIGPGAHSLAPDARRWTEEADLDRWMRADDPRTGVERPSPWQAAADALVSGCRAIDGVDLAALARDTGMCPREDAVQALISGGVLRRDGDRIAPTDEGFSVADGLSRRLVDALRPVEGGPLAR